MKDSIQNLVGRAQRGDVEAFAELVRMFEGAVFGAAWAAVRNFDDAQDIAQETFVLAYLELPRLREPEKFPGWLRRLTTTACGRFLRSRREACIDLGGVEDRPAETPRPDVVAQALELRERIFAEIASLSEENRLVTTLFLIDGYSHKEVGEFLDLPVSTVKSRLHESRKKLQGGLMEMAKDLLHANKPDDEFVKKLKKKISGRIVQLTDGGVQVFYDFVDPREMKDWRTRRSYDAAPKAEEGEMAFGRVEDRDTEKQWDRDIRLNLVLDPDPDATMEIEFDVKPGTCEPWMSAGWVLTRRDGYGSGIPFFYAVITDHCPDWRKEGSPWFMGLKDGHVRADFLVRCDYYSRIPWKPSDERERPGYCRWVVLPQDLPIADSYRMKIVRSGRLLAWEVDGRKIGETGLADHELALTERLILCNYGKGSGAAFGNLVVRGRLLDVDTAWSAAEAEA